MKYKFILIVMIALAWGVHSAYASDSVLRELDGIIKERHIYEGRKQEAVMKAKADFATAAEDSDKYNVLRELYNAFRTFRIDSALIIADQRLAIARRMGVESRIASASINLAESYVKSGSPDEALHILDTLNESKLEDYHRKYRNSVLRNAYSLKAATAMLPSDRMRAGEKLRALRDSAAKDISPDTKGYYTLQAEKLMDAGMNKEAVAKMEEADRRFDFSQDAAMQYTMGEIYLKAGRRQEAIDRLAKAACIDLTQGVKEYRSLILLASLLFEEGDVERAFNYINVAFEDASFSNANMRTPEIMKSMPVIDQAFHAHEKEETRKTRLFLIFAGVLVLLLVGLRVVLWKTLVSNRKMLSTIEDFNQQLETRNRQLVEADRLKLQNINTLMLSNARYISRLKDFRKGIYRLMKTGQYDQALDNLKSGRIDAKDITAFHELFDQSFLSMFPDFITSVNRLLATPIEPKGEGRLTPELRVMALMRLGLTSTEDISGMLHYSAQTVYNLRNSIRNMTELSKEEFERKIREI